MPTENEFSPGPTRISPDDLADAIEIQDTVIEALEDVLTELNPPIAEALSALFIMYLSASIRAGKSHSEIRDLLIRSIDAVKDDIDAINGPYNYKEDI